MEEPLIKIQHISKSYQKRAILKDISIDIRQGEIIGIIGSSGTGKTTLLNALIGFIKPDSGNVLFRQQSLVSGTSNVIYKSIYKDKTVKNMYGFAAQVPSFYEKLTVRENLEYFGQMYNLSQDTLQANIATLLKLMNLENSQNILGKNLSGGMERRLDIACALIHNPQLLILDEPTADLDPLLRNNIWHLIEQINAKGTTIIISSHHLNEIETLCSKIAILKDGLVLDIGSASELKQKFTTNQEIRLESYPGNYNKLGPLLQKKFKDNIVAFENKGNELLLLTKKPHEVINDIMKAVEKENEKIMELKLVKPSLDQVFISLNQTK